MSCEAGTPERHSAESAAQQVGVPGHLQGQGRNVKYVGTLLVDSAYMECNKILGGPHTHTKDKRLIGQLCVHARQTFSPLPAALMLNKKMKTSLLGALKRLMALDEQPVQHTQLATLPQQLRLVGPKVWGVAQGRVVAHLAQLHAFVVQGGEIVAVGFADAGVKGGEAQGACGFDPVIDHTLGGASEQQAAQGGEAVQVPRQLALPVLHALRLINDDILPLNLRAMRIKRLLYGSRYEYRSQGTGVTGSGLTLC
ncbi:MAG: hypothetical protein FRX49_00893 [Trebouxia sp. A1-2]|nr:MAG: hypothetical protein FRX49_00893 [Trebouxia sp. A1-2]